MRAAPPSFDERVWDLVRQVPRGRVTTYGWLARRLGRPRLARAVGYALARCPAQVPWHRVLNAHGQVSPRRPLESVQLQRQLLEAEGVAFDDRGQVDLAEFGYD